MGDNLKDKTIGALKWTTIDRLSQQIIQFIVGIILARLLTPNQFGLIGVLLIFNALSTVLIDGGFGQALIRKQNATIVDFSTVFFVNLFVSSFLYILLYFSAPFIANFFSQSELINIARVYFIAIFFYALYFIQYVHVVKEMQYKKMAIVNIISVLISGIVAISLAFNNFGVWTLVYQQIIYQLIRAILFILNVKWKPKFIFSFDTLKESWRFSLNLLGTISLNVIFNHIYIIIIGKFFPIRQVGFYNQANKLSETVNSGVLQVLQNTIFPVFVQIQDQMERFKRIYRKITSIVSILFFPVIFVLIAVAEPLILFLISDKWLLSVRFFQLLLLSNLFSPLFLININTLNASGKSGITFKLELVKKGMITLSIIMSFSFGITWMLVGLIISNFLSYFFSMYFVKNTFNHYYKNQLFDIIVGLCISFIIGCIIYSLNFVINSIIIRLVIQFIIAVLLYIISFRLFHKYMFDKFSKLLYDKIKKANCR